MIDGIHYPAGIRIYDDAFDPSFCDRVTALFRRNPPIDRIYDADYRCCSMVEIPSASDQTSETASIFEIFRSTSVSILGLYKSSLRGADTLGYCCGIEQPNALRYAPGAAKKQHFHEHSDNWNRESATRQLSLVAYCNDVDVGGRTVFPHLGIAVAPKRGRVLAFPSFFTHAHLAEEPISGEKVAVVTWIHIGHPPHGYKTFPLG